MRGRAGARGGERGREGARATRRGGPIGAVSFSSFTFLFRHANCITHIGSSANNTCCQ